MDFFFSLLCFWTTIVGLAPVLPCADCISKKTSGFTRVKNWFFNRTHSNVSVNSGGLPTRDDIINDISASSNVNSGRNDRTVDGNTMSGGKCTCAFIGDGASSLFQTLGVVVVAPCVQYSRTALASFVIPMTLAACIPIGSTIYVWCRCGSVPLPNTTTIFQRVVGCVLALSGLGFFALVQTRANYTFVHSFWHCMIALSLYFLLPNSDHKKVPSQNKECMQSSVWTDTSPVFVAESDHGNEESSFSGSFRVNSVSNYDDTTLVNPSSRFFMRNLVRRLLPNSSRLFDYSPQNNDQPCPISASMNLTHIQHSDNGELSLAVSADNDVVILPLDDESSRVDIVDYTTSGEEIMDAKLVLLDDVNT